MMTAVFGMAASACDSGGVGDPCIPEDEYYQEFGGYGVGEVNVESKSFQCETRLCLVNAFQGRVSCPYGQEEEHIAAGDPARICKIPGTDGTRPEDRVTVPVAAQLIDRRPDKTVYCSCRCANAEGNTDDGQRYCECPDGFQCTRLVEDVGLGSANLAGSYCIKNDSEYDPAVADDRRCVYGSAENDPTFCGKGNDDNPDQ